ncbi:hypothetical protein NPIL_650861 [Nephila pilipes]|uniref:Uncharacterized protein n=1 Tax=Nephila pilipes TaxID=299642 RepID=A0A8X6U640_NEPPI|nr:hypothetical protein NPIL_650861 [Nephila pilipes]
MARPVRFCYVFGLPAKENAKGATNSVQPPAGAYALKSTGALQRGYRRWREKRMLSHALCRRRAATRSAAVRLRAASGKSAAMRVLPSAAAAMFCGAQAMNRLYADQLITGGSV